MTLHLPRPHGRHRAVDKVHKLEAENAKLACALVTARTAIDVLTAECKRVEGQLDTAGIALTGAWSDLDKAVTEIRRLQQQHGDDAITIARLRRELHNARPRISVVATTAERPMAPDSVPLTYQTVKEVA
ncbi:hypothetical protein [Streptomyces sp. 5-6(2022)]|uniref:hypothetical protein n=1 Tax=Streptomyces sp. 5-6(2022) TaxID=2936510 RepID=UPI0023B9523E|nr:hypothetical protein [Streptomyces sp. 5-6(2022)]